MPEPISHLLEQLEHLVRFTAPGELGEAFLQDDELPRDPAPAEAPAYNGRASRRRRNPRSGGVLFPRDSKASWAVNVRPKNWGDKDKIWWGKIKSMVEAKRISDIVHYYLGSGPVHFLFPGPGCPPPPFINSNLRPLNSMEQRMQYVKLIAKGEEHQARRKELMESVKEMVKYLTSAVVRHEDEIHGVEAVEAAAAMEELPWTGTNRSQPELGGDDDCRLSPEIPSLVQEEIESMMAMVLDDVS